MSTDVVSRIHYRCMHQASHNLLVAVGGWGVLLLPSYRAAVLAYPSVPQYSNRSGLTMRRASAKRGEAFFKGKKQTFSLSQPPPAGVPSVTVPTGLSRHSHQLELRLHKKKDRQTENSARMHFIKGNNIHYIVTRFSTDSMCQHVKANFLVAASHVHYSV